jgi:hypothetical protein
MKKLLIIAMIFVPVSVFAHGSVAEMTAAAVDSATEKLETDSPAALQKFIGVKGWPAADKLMVKFYLNDNTEIVYTCEHQHVNGNMVINCSK